MKKILAVLLMMWSLTAFSQEVVYDFSTERGDRLVLLDAPCNTTVGIFANMPVDVRPEFSAAVIYWDNVAFQACWTYTPDKKHFVIDETGDQGIVEGSVFGPIPLSVER